MLTRITSGIILFLLLVFFLLIGGVLLQIGVTAIIVIGMFELYRAFSKKVLPVHFVGYIFAIIYMIMANKVDNFNVLFIITVLFIFSVLITLVLQHQKMTPIDAIVTIFGFFYVAVFMSCIYFVRISDFGYILVWLIFISSWGCDTGAYFAGVLFGKHKLIPTLSPKKTIEGSIGGILLSTLLGMGFGYIVSLYVDINHLNILHFCTIASFAGSIFSQFGDLSASAIKRYTKIKDYGTLIPGHGGIIDRFDSVIFTAPAVYIVMLLMTGNLF